MLKGLLGNSRPSQGLLAGLLCDPFSFLCPVTCPTWKRRHHLPLCYPEVHTGVPDEVAPALGF